MIAFAPTSARRRRGLGFVEDIDPSALLDGAENTSGLAADDPFFGATEGFTMPGTYDPGFDSGSLGGSIASSPALATVAVAETASESFDGLLHGEAARDAGYHVGATDAAHGKAPGTSKAIAASVVAPDGLAFFNAGYDEGYYANLETLGGDVPSAPKATGGGATTPVIDPATGEPVSEGWSTGAKVGAGLAAVAVIGLGVAVFRKKKRAA